MAKLLLVEAEFLVETADTSTGVHHLLLAGKEGVTLGTNFHADVLLGGAGLDHVAAGTGNGSLLIVGMNALSHVVFTSFTFGMKRRSKPPRLINAMI